MSVELAEALLELDEAGLVALQSGTCFENLVGELGNLLVQIADGLALPGGGADKTNNSEEKKECFHLFFVGASGISG